MYLNVIRYVDMDVSIIMYCECCGRMIDEIKLECMCEGEQHGQYLVSGVHRYHVKGDWVDTNDSELRFCGCCGAKLTDSDIKYEYESHEFWGALCSERIILGYHCEECGEDAEF